MNILSTLPQENEVKEIIILISLNKDAVEFYSAAQESVVRFSLKNTFSDLEQIHGSTILRLEEIIKPISRRNSVQNADESFLGAAKGIFSTLALELSTRSDLILIQCLAEAEYRCLYAMEKLILDKSTSMYTRQLLQREWQTLQICYKHMIHLKQTIAA